MDIAPLMTPRAGSTGAEHDSAEKPVGRLLSNALNHVLLPIEVAALKAFERGYELVTGHVLFHALAPAPAPVALKRPLLMIPGLFMQPNSFDAVANHFANAPGQAKNTLVYSAADGELHLKNLHNPPVKKDAELRAIKPIKLAFSNAEGTCEDKAKEIDRALDTIYARYGQTLHVAAHSQGNEALFLALLQRARAGKPAVIESFTDIGGVDKGTFLGNIGAVAGGIAGVKESGAEVAFGGPVIAEIHAHWDLIKTQIKGTIHNVAFAAGPTLGADGKVGVGDGFVTVEDQGVPGADKEVLKVPLLGPDAHLIEADLPGSAAAVQATIVKDEARIAG